MPLSVVATQIQVGGLDWQTRIGQPRQTGSCTFELGPGVGAAPGRVRESSARWILGAVPAVVFGPVKPLVHRIDELFRLALGSEAREYPLDKLRIDQSFVRDMIEDPAARAITGTLASPGKTLRMRMAAEEVEHREELRMLGTLGCDDVTGKPGCRRPTNSSPGWMNSARIHLRRILKPRTPAKTT
jgi:hypothetical protein